MDKKSELIIYTTEDGLTKVDISVEPDKGVKKEQPKTTSIDTDRPISTQKEEPIVPLELTSSIKAFDFGEEKVKKEIKSVRKQFVFSPTYAKWLNETAKLNNISENLVIERLMERAMNS